LDILQFDWESGLETPVKEWPMKKIILLGTVLGVSMAFAPRVEAQTLKSGVWNYRTTNHWVKGRCPAPRPGKGKIKILRTGKQFSVRVLSGMKCKPKSLCFFRGFLKGKLWIASNSAKVDNGGGKARNQLEFRVRTNRRLTGTDHSEYTHPSGFKCQWGFKFVATR
jgi:hypothetical protein